MRFIFIVGGLVLLVGILLYPPLLTYLFSPDQSIKDSNLILVNFFRLISVLSGLAILLTGILLNRYKQHWFERLNRVSINLFLAIGTTVFVLMIAEFAFRWTNRYGVNFVKHSMRYFSEAIIESEDPVLVYELKPAYSGKLGVEIRINTKGLRDYEYTYEKPEGVFRILCLGDSVTLGWGVPFEKTYVRLLENLLNNSTDKITFQVINFGVGGYNTVQEAAFLRNEGLKYNPDLILLFYTINDATKTIQPFKLPEYPENIKQDVIQMSQKAASAVFIKLFPSIFGLYYYLKMPRIDYELEFREEQRLGWKTSQKGILDIVDMSKSAHGNVIVFMVPAMQNLDRRYPFKNIHEAVKVFCEKHRIPFIDLLPDFQDIPNKAVRLSVFDGHPNKFAHNIIARSVYNNLKRIMKRTDFDRD